MDEEELIVDTDGTEEAGMSEEDLEATESRADAKASKFKKELDTCKAERQEYMDGWQRAKADYVNVLKRGEEERKAAEVRGTLKAAKSFIGVLDSLARAELSGEVPEAFQAISRQLRDAALSLGLAPFGAVGEAFNPIEHEALGNDAVADATLDATVTAVLEQGWKTGDMVVRPAKVRVGQLA